jgi:hypothetical protein
MNSTIWSRRISLTYLLGGFLAFGGEDGSNDFAFFLLGDAVEVVADARLSVCLGGSLKLGAFLAGGYLPPTFGMWASILTATSS